MEILLHALLPPCNGGTVAVPSRLVCVLPRAELLLVGRCLALAFTPVIAR
jgi:hypothetical protein